MTMTSSKDTGYLLAGSHQEMVREVLLLKDVWSSIQLALRLLIQSQLTSDATVLYGQR